MFVNFSNHPSSSWSNDQIQAARQWGEPIDYPFPAVPSEMSAEEVRELADGIVREIAGMEPDAVMCQGEFTLTFSVVNKLKDLGIPVVAACSERIVEERIGEDGQYEKIAHFQFVQFREY